MKEKVIVITGSTSGIGLAVAKRFGDEENYSVVINSRNSDGENITQEVAGNCLFIKADISTKEGCNHLIEQTVNQFGSIDLLVNNAGIFVPEQELTEDNEVEMFRIKLSGIQHCSDYAIANGATSIVNISSVYAHKPKHSARISSALQAGVENLTLNYAKQMAGKVRVNAVAPGYVDTPMVRSNITESDLKSIIDDLPLKRLIKAEEIADTIYFLATNLIITGQVIIADGGYRL